MDVFTWVPSKTTQIKPRFAVLTARFGDGYTQDSANGINNVMRDWLLQFNGTEAAVAYLIIQFLETHAGQRFLWTQPFPFNTEGQKIYVCNQSPQFQYSGGLVIEGNAMFEQRV